MYCRQHLGASYFDELSESELDEGDPSQSLEDSETEADSDRQPTDSEMTAGSAGSRCHEGREEGFNGLGYHCEEASDAGWEEQA
ncbi:hypothetical protein TRAPUB_8580 [Trametes pubescens]|uniref:Uncharacterized protein n=1 Tax=Trametes pubescens TaxID=154538 RepID=A0A1M2W4X3_TRAPU|nr:hypothetical protein TRAPUB_8580 [Trametes pubescens]